MQLIIPDSSQIPIPPLNRTLPPSSSTKTKKPCQAPKSVSRTAPTLSCLLQLDRIQLVITVPYCILRPGLSRSSGFAFGKSKQYQLPGRDGRQRYVSPIAAGAFSVYYNSGQSFYHIYLLQYIRHDRQTGDQSFMQINDLFIFRFAHYSSIQ
jgi:hypothetical protein